MLGREWNTTRESAGNGSFHSALECALAMDGKNVCRVARRYIKLSCSGGSGNNNHHHISITRCKANKKKKGKTFSRISPGRHHRLSWLRLMRLAKMGSDLVRPSLKIVKRHKHTTKKSKEYPKRTRRRCL